MVAKMKGTIAFKLFRVRKDGTIGSLFIGRGQRYPTYDWLKAKNKRKLPKGFVRRAGFHSCALPYAPHLSLKGRQWYYVLIHDIQVHNRPRSQGEKWYTSKYMMVLAPLSETDRKGMLRVTAGEQKHRKNGPKA